MWDSEQGMEGNHTTGRRDLTQDHELKRKDGLQAQLCMKISGLGLPPALPLTSGFTLSVPSLSSMKRGVVIITEPVPLVARVIQ